MDRSLFNTNFKNLILFVGTAASKHKECPLPNVMIQTMVSFIFDDSSRASKLKDRFRENRDLICQRYGSNVTLTSLIAAKDRSLFNHIDLFPSWVREEHPKTVNWFSEFLANGMEEKYMKWVWAYLDAMNKQA